MTNDQDWLWNIIACPECGRALGPGQSDRDIRCVNEACHYTSQRTGRLFNLLPLALDRFQIAENDFRVNNLNRAVQSVPQMNEAQRATFKLLNILTYYSFTSEYFFFRDFFSKRYPLQGRGLEIGGAAGQWSGFIKLFYPDTEMVTSDVAPINVTRAEELAKRLPFDTDYFVMADAERLPFLPGSFDFVCSSGMLHHLGDMRRALQKGHAVLKPGGRWYVVNELSVGALPRLFWNSRLGAKGRWAQTTGIREKSYTLKEWTTHFAAQNFKIVDTYFHRDAKHKLQSWSRALYYAVIAKFPPILLKTGIPCEVNFVLEKK